MFVLVTVHQNFPATVIRSRAIFLMQWEKEYPHYLVGRQLNIFFVKAQQLCLVPFPIRDLKPQPIKEEGRELYKGTQKAALYQVSPYSSVLTIQGVGKPLPTWHARQFWSSYAHLTYTWQFKQDLTNSCALQFVTLFYYLFPTCPAPDFIYDTRYRTDKIS